MVKIENHCIKKIRLGHLLPTLLCISDDWAPRLIQSISCNVRNRKKKNFETIVGGVYRAAPGFARVCLLFERERDF